MRILLCFKTPNIIGSFLFLLFSATAFAQGQQSNVVIGTVHKIQSRVLGEERRYYVNLPASYDNDDFYLQKKYPVLILLDGDSHFHSASGIIRAMGDNEQIPEMIVVAVTNTNRTRDFTPTKSGTGLSGGADNFLRFLETELLPQVSKDYRTLPYRVLVGHSLGGLFAVDTLLNQKVFNAFLAIDPTLTWDDQLPVKKAKTVFADKKSFNATLYLAQANNPFNEGKNAGARGAAFQSFHSILANSKAEGLRYKYDFYEREDHFSVPLLSLYHGLTFIFDGYKFPLHTLANKNAEDVKKHYEMFARRLGVDILPPGKLLDGAALFLLNSEKKVDKAIELLRLNQTYYPQSSIPYNSLGAAYKTKGETALALSNYQKSLELNPKNEIAQRAVIELTPAVASPHPAVITKTGLRYQVVTEGNGAIVMTGQTVRIHETTTLVDGTVLYSTRPNNRPLKFLLGGNQVIAGVDEGVLGMKVGEHRKLIVLPALSKRSNYPANTPPDAILYYDIELVEIVNN